MLVSLHIGLHIAWLHQLHRMPQNHDRASPMVRRCGKLTLAAMEATLAVYLTGRAWKEIPTLRLLGMSADALHRRATEIANACNAIDGLRATIQKHSTECGGTV